MKTKCPACGATTSLDSLLGHSEASQAFVSVLSLVGDLATPLVKYLAMFRSENRDLTFERTAKLISELAADINARQIKRGHHSYPAPKAAWIWAINVMLERRDQGKLQLPLKNHGYLYEVITSYKPDQSVSFTSLALTPTSGMKRKKTSDELAADHAEHERLKYAKPNTGFAEMMGFTQMNNKHPERGLKNIPKEQLMAHVSQNKQPNETLEQCYQRLKSAEALNKENLE